MLIMYGYTMKRLIFLALLSIFVINEAIAQTNLSNNDLLKYIGQTKEVLGNPYKVELRAYKTTPDSANVLLYMGDANKDFIIIVKVNMKGNSAQAKWGKAIQASEQITIKQKNKEGGGIGARGEIFLFENKPAIMINYDDLEILEKVD
jgi:hypothetical protein